MKSLRYLPLILLLMISLIFAQGNLSILLVDDDNYSSPDHITRIETAITDAGYSYDVFNAQDSAASPTAAFMQNYKLVIWYMANDGVGGYFWHDGTNFNTDNPELISYLNNGGMLWVMGNDVLYDRYGGAPDTFQVGDFVYDYLGVSSYDVQSKINDGGNGVPMLLKVPGQNIATLDTVRWYFSSGGLWYADGCTPAPGAVSVYEFGDSSYVLAGYITSIYNDNGTSKVLSCFWDAYYMDTQAHRATLFQGILDWFASQLPPPPTAFNLQAPVNGAEIWISEPFSGLFFYWSASSNPGGGSLSYEMVIAQDSALTNIMNTYPSNTNQVMLTLDDLWALFQDEDTLDVWWSVKAIGDGGITWASDTFALRLVENINEPPEPFLLLEPPDQSVWVVAEDSSQTFTFRWQQAVDPDNNLDHYHFYFTAPYPTEVNFIDTVLTDTSIAFTTSDLLPLFNVGTGSDTIFGNWYVTANDSATYASSLDTFALTLIKLPHVNQPPLPFAMLTPPNGAQLLVDSLNEQILFSWEATTDPEGDPFHYDFSLYLTNPGSDSLITTVELTDTQKVMFGNDFNNYFATFGDTLHCYWTVSATDVYLNTTVADTFYLDIIENIPEMPTAPTLLYPQADKTLFFTANGATSYLFFWHSATDPDNDSLTYTITLTTSTDSVVYSFATGDTSVTVDIGSYLTAMGQDSVMLKWNVQVSDGVFQVPSSNGPRQLSFFKQKISLLFVDDDNYSNHEGYLYDALNHLGVQYDVFDCGALNGGDTVEFIPDYQTLEPYDMVLWFTGNDGVGLALWNGADTVNSELKDYLDNGGRLWMSGNDFLYDLYGGAPDTFQVGDFVYDYFGISSYDAQSKVDDGGTGVPMLLRDPNCGISTLDTIDWRYSGLWYVDAVTPLPNATPIFRMGPASYALADMPAAVYYNTTTFMTVTFYFNMRQIETSDYYRKLEKLMADMLAWIQQTSPIVGIEKPEEPAELPRRFAVHPNYPNPFNPTTTIAYELPRSGRVEVSIYNILGQKVATLVKGNQKAGRYKLQVDASRWASGVYFFRVRYREQQVIRKMLLIK